LLKPEFAQGEKALSKKRVLAKQTLSLSDGSKATLFTRQGRPNPPRWARFFDNTSANLGALSTRSASAVMLIGASKRHFALAFGTGRHDLIPGCWEDSFGLRVSVNSIDETKIRSIDSETFEAVARHTLTQSSHEGETSYFGLDVDRALLRAITGTPRNPKLGKRLAGMDALAATVQAQLDDLPELLGAYLDRFQSDEYKRHFGWIDHVKAVRDPGVVRLLDDALLARLKDWNENDGSKVWLVAPDVVDWNKAGHFTYSNSYIDEKPDLHLKDFLQIVSDRKALTVKSLKQRPVVLWDPGGDDPYETWTAYGCIYAEVDQGGETYLLASGKWYGVEKSFSQTVKTEVTRLVSTVPPLPPYVSTDTSEAKYNERVAQSSSNYALLDRKTVMYGGGLSRFEVCDLLTKANEMIHVKRYGGSAPLSHLFAQGVNSAQLWMGDEKYRARVAKKLPPSHALPDSKPRPATNKYTVVYAIVSQSKKPIDESLPFFSCLTLVNAARDIRTFGMKVSLVKIQRQ
jgi:uncharacterized protein (TIGR04141 family)